MLVNFREYILKIVLTRSIFSGQNAPNSVWRPGSARNRWRSLQHSPDTIAGLREAYLLPREGNGKKVKGEEGDGVEGDGREEKGK